MSDTKQEPAIDERIASFIKGNSNMTLATAEDGNPYCAHCFYAFDASRGWLVFKSGAETLHIRQAMRNPRVAGAIAPDRLERHAIRGIQFRGLLVAPEGTLVDEAERIYYRRHPYARLVHGSIWMIRLEEMKMTDNTLGFGRKLHWQAGDRPVEPMER